MTQEIYDNMLAGMYRFTVPLVKCKETVELIDAGKNILFFDIRSKAEYETSHIAGAKFYDYETFNVSQIDKSLKGEMIIMYCSVGYRSELAAEKLIKSGFENVFNLYGGIFQWIHESHELVDITGAKTERVHTYNKKWSKWLMKGKKVYE